MMDYLSKEYMYIVKGKMAQFTGYINVLNEATIYGN